MAKKRRKRNRRTRHARVVPTKSGSETVALYRRAQTIETISVILGIPLLLVVTQFKFAGDAVQKSSNWIYVPYISTWFVIGWWNAKTSQRASHLKFQFKTQSGEYLTVLKNKIIITSIATILCVLGFFYLAGGDQLVRYLLGKVVPTIFGNLIPALAHILEWIFSGVVGGLAYKYFESARKKLSKNQKNP